MDVGVLGQDELGHLHGGVADAATGRDGLGAQVWSGSMWVVLLKIERLK
jgi:hypothetical protein